MSDLIPQEPTQEPSQNFDQQVPQQNSQSVSNCFSSLSLQQGLVDNLASLGYETMTPIQAQALPPIIEGRDVIGQGKTGSGKTAAFGLGLLQRLDVKKFRIQSLVLCPTRELADQVAKEIRRLGRGIHNIKVLTLCGGSPFGPQVGSLEHGAHIVVGTPGRIEEHVRKKNLDLSHLSTLVLDEADRMLDMGFAESLEEIIDAAPKQRQTLLFSATFPSQIRRMSMTIMREPLQVHVESTHEATTIQQLFFKVDDEQRLAAVELLLLKYAPETAVVFCNTKVDTQEVVYYLQDQGFAAIALNGDLEQRDRDVTLVRFSNKSAQVLVATDVAARGLDIDALDMVINFHLPRETDVHVHRIGRTGRAGAKGLACSLFSEKERFKLSTLEERAGQPVVYDILPNRQDLHNTPLVPEMVTLQIDGGRKQKIRPGDIVGCLTGDNTVAGTDVGKIMLFDNSAFVAVKHAAASAALKKIQTGKLKGRSFRVRKIS